MTEALDWRPAVEHPELLAVPVATAVAAMDSDGILVAAIDPDLADTEALCARYDVTPEESGNCVVVAGARAGEERFVACVVMATTRADVNGIARRRIDVRKASFAKHDLAVARTGMEYGGITPIGLPPGWPILVDAAVAAAPRVVVGSGVRRSKLALPGPVLASAPGVEVVEGLGR